MNIILTEVFLHGDTNESNPANIYLDGETFVAICEDGTEKRFELAKPFEELAKNEDIRNRILDYRGLPHDGEFLMEDVFMQGEFIKEIISHNKVGK